MVYFLSPPPSHVLLGVGGGTSLCPPPLDPPAPPPSTTPIGGLQAAIFSILLSKSGLWIVLLPGGKTASAGGRGAERAFVERREGEMEWKGLQRWER